MFLLIISLDIFLYGYVGSLLPLFHTYDLLYNHVNIFDVFHLFIFLIEV